MRKWWILLLIVLVLCSCSRERPEDVSALALAMAAAGEGGNGTLYAADRLGGGGLREIDALPASLAAAAFGGGREPEEFGDLEAYAVWLSSFAEPVEYGCFVVARERDVDAIAQMCLRRMEMIRRLCGEEAVSEPPLVIGRCVFYAAGEQAAAALDAARAAMGG